MLVFNANLNSHGDLGAACAIQVSGCGQFTKDPAYKAAMDCGDRDPPDPAYVSSHAYEVATSNEILDMQRFNNSRLSCFSRRSRHCSAEFEAWKTEANSLPEDPETDQGYGGNCRLRIRRGHLPALLRGGCTCMA